MNLGDKLKKLRLDKGVTQEQVSIALNIAPNTLSNYENNNRQPDNEMLIKIAKYFSISTDYLLGISNNPNPTKKGPLDEPLQIAASMKDGLDLSDMSEHDKEIIRSLVESMKNNKK